MADARDLIAESAAEITRRSQKNKAIGAKGTVDTVSITRPNFGTLTLPRFSTSWNSLRLSWCRGVLDCTL